ncbi:MAG: nucleotide sugar dehydrogenase [bacterium]
MTPPSTLRTTEPASIYLIAVPTPFLANKAPDLRAVEAATRAIAGVIRRGDLVILESTSPPRTTTNVVGPLIESVTGLKAGVEFRLAYCPERVLPGQILAELRANDRIIGGIDAASTGAASAFYSRFVTGELLPSDATTAETVKLVENAFRDVNIAFANEVSLIAHTLGVDAAAVIRLANRHPRVNVLQPGVGVGGHCIGVDPWFLVDAAPADANLIRTARKVNEYKREWVAERILEAALAIGPTCSIGLLGATYKPDVADIRESPALWIAQEVTRRHQGPVVVCEPHRESLEGVTLATLTDAVTCDLVVVLVRHKEFAGIAGSGPRFI